MTTDGFIVFINNEFLSNTNVFTATPYNMEIPADFHIYSVHSCQSPKLGHKKAATAAGRLAVRRNGMFLKGGWNDQTTLQEWVNGVKTRWNPAF